ncbi:hypothetical protein J7I98_37100 [Streptomyces sp. ISL-98]|uniref:hypothetical protein n=1 Tax=Streptomyces sp. ISL-98 TaxID=2819192 RepID=UPI001BECB42C|nr:hypothetical protein [Streptomyces sp. ISL-98]MBT2511339.1 hypothetical protein [Streptomyces sp. ISL-98]
MSLNVDELNSGWPAHEVHEIVVLREFVDREKLGPALAEKLLTFNIAEVTRHYETMTRG